MSREQLPTDQGLRELLAECALGNLDASEEAALVAVDGVDQAEFEFAEAMAAIELANGAGAELMPAPVRARLEAAADAFIEGERTPATPTRAPVEASDPSAPDGRGWFAIGGWVAAAACLAILVFSLGPAGDSQPGSPGARFDEFVATQTDLQTFAWHPWAMDGVGPEVADVTGSVVWSESAQTGFMRFSGLPANDPEALQYQLWIVDSRGLFDETGQSARISGGVFDASDAYLDVASGDLIVPINARLTVQGAAAFALTIEAPGGTWVSDMTRRVVWTVAG